MRTVSVLPIAAAMVTLVSQGQEAGTVETSEQLCLAYIDIGENYKTAHRNESCQQAAELGVGSAQYSVGMGYGFDGDAESEERYYRLAAGNRIVAAYLALGHVLAKSDPWEAIYWYQRFFATRTEGYGYAALRLADIFESLGNDAQSDYWMDACRGSDYASQCNGSTREQE